ncbi:MAG: hypothetical protein M1830_006338 [Pleopsidium flavum]|nr:MAG: hypothetical protein M1830_006338 [Pleopsidium flavum]
MAPRRRTLWIGLPPFRSPRSKAKTEERQFRREYFGRLEWATPIGRQQLCADHPNLRSDDSTEISGKVEMEEPPDLDIGEALIPLIDCEATQNGVDNDLYLCMQGRPSPSRVSHQDLNMTTSAGGVSPSSSPRLPSPPPFTEVQIGPKSPTVGAIAAGSEHELGGVNIPDVGATRRIRPGTRAADMASGPPLVPLAELDSPFQLQEHLKALYYAHTKTPNSNHQVPITRETAIILAQPPENIERSLWLYELCRFLTQKANNLIVAFFAETPPCSAQTCPEMRASEWQYLCAVHDPPKSCCAIDYCCHTLDWASSILTSQKHFPSRLTLGSESTGGTQQGVRQLTNIFRRVYRIFAHAWFQHRQVFWQVEGHDGLYVFFKTVCDVYSLIPEDNYTIPPEAEGIVSDETPVGDDGEQGYMAILKKDDEDNAGEVTDATTTISTGATTRRHKHTPSTGSAVTTIAEGDEEDHKGEDTRASATSAPEEPEPEPTAEEETSKTDKEPLVPRTDIEPEPEAKAEGEDTESTNKTHSPAVDEEGTAAAPDPDSQHHNQTQATEERGKDSTVEEKTEVSALTEAVAEGNTANEET